MKDVHFFVKISIVVVSFAENFTGTAGCSGQPLLEKLRHYNHLWKTWPFAKSHSDRVISKQDIKFLAGNLLIKSKGRVTLAGSLLRATANNTLTGSFFKYFLKTAFPEANFIEILIAFGSLSYKGNSNETIFTLSFVFSLTLRFTWN